MSTAGTAVDVVELTPAIEAGYADFVARHPEAMIYPTLEFRQFLSRAIGGEPRYAVALRGSTVVGVLPAFVAHDERWGAVVNSLPWYGSHGGCLVAPGDGREVRAALLEHLRCRVLSPGTAFSTVILTPDENERLDEYAALLQPTTTDYRIGQITRLPEAGDDLETRLEHACRQKTRNLIRKALKQGFTMAVRDDEAAWRFLYDTHCENMAAIGGKAKPWAHFAALREAIPAAWRQLIVTSAGAVPAAAMLLLRFNRTVEYLTPVVKHEFRSLQALSFTIWHGMLDAARSGYRWWNWGGTWASQRSLHHFKAGWGAVDRPYTYLVRGSERALRELAHDRDALTAAFPYYFLYPFQA